MTSLPLSIAEVRGETRMESRKEQISQERNQAREDQISREPKREKPGKESSDELNCRDCREKPRTHQYRPLANKVAPAPVINTRQVQDLLQDVRTRRRDRLEEGDEVVFGKLADACGYPYDDAREDHFGRSREDHTRSYQSFYGEKQVDTIGRGKRNIPRNPSKIASDFACCTLSRCED